MIAAVLVAFALLLAGFVLRQSVGVFRWLFIPASVIGGFVGFAIVQCLSLTQLRVETIEPIRAQLAGWPGVLIAVVFAGLLIERSDASFVQAFRRSARQGVMAWIIILGQVLVGVTLTAIFVRPALDVPLSFGQLIEAGFAGGHGTAGAMGVVFAEQFQFPAGLDLGLFFATFGLVWGVVSGIALVNIGLRRGWTKRKNVESISTSTKQTEFGPIGIARVAGDVIDPLALQAALLALAFGLGYLMQLALGEAIAFTSARIESAAGPLRFLDNLPLFLFTLIGGLIVREGLRLLKLDRLIDGGSMKRLTSLAMELLIVSALATLRLEAIREYFWPAALLLVAGAAWCVFCLLVLAPRLLPKSHWFELGLINYGMSTATTAQGMMLLRLVDRELESDAAEEYALAAPLTAPFIGGGVLTVAGFPLMFSALPAWLSVLILAAAMAALLALGFAIARRAE